MTTKRPALGKGLSALLSGKSRPDTESPAKPHEADAHHGLRRVTDVPLDRVTPNRYQARKNFDEDAIEDLAQSIARSGILQPLAVRSLSDGSGKYELIAGERRLRAARKAGLKTVPVLVMEVDDKELSILSLVENLQREDLNAIEKAESLHSISEMFQMTQEQLAQSLGKSRSAVANLLRLLSLPETVKTGLATQRISEGHARALLGLPDADEIVIGYNEITARGWSVRETEKYVARIANRDSRRSAKSGTKAAPPKADFNLQAHIRHLSEIFGTKVTVAGGEDEGKVEVHYFSREDRDRVLELLGQKS